MPMTRISEKDHQVLLDISGKTGMSHQEIIHEALDTYQRDQLLDAINEGFEKLKADDSKWKELSRERRELDKTGNDGLSD